MIYSNAECLPGVERCIVVHPSKNDGLIRVWYIDSTARYGEIGHIPEGIPEGGHHIRSNLHHQTIFDDAGFCGQTRVRFQSSIEDHKTGTGHCEGKTKTFNTLQPPYTEMTEIGDDF